MDTKSTTTLELPKILERLARHTAFTPGRELALALQPSNDPDEVRRRLELTSEARNLVASKSSARIGGARDVRGQIAVAAKAGILTPQELLDIRQTIVSARTLKRLLERLEGQVPRLAAIVAGIEPLQALTDAIENAVDEAAEIRDNASPDLGRIRRDLQIAHSRLMERLNRLVSDSATSRYLQEPIITQRGGRYVVPLKVEHKGKIQGVVHDQSSSGATLWIEPLATLELNNRWRELELAEQREVERILRELSGLVGDNVDELTWLIQALAELDLQFAKAEYAFEIKGREPLLTDPLQRLPNQPYLNLLQARHPLLDPATVVPTDIWLGPDFHVLVITGPNTGGKTVALKTVGLLTLMAQCGLHIPAQDGSTLPIFADVYADIGDEQSIEQSLSTFSAHMTNIIRILEQATPDSLVILDELGAGTDPVEGSALARALLVELLERNISAMVATHYSELKVFAHGTEGVRNASVEFDVETLRPTYRLSIGLPGRSNALNIAQRLGLSTGIIEQARSLISAEALEVDDLLEDIKQAREQALADRSTTETARAEADRLRQELRRQIAGIEEERRAVLNQAREEAADELERVKAQLRDAVRRIERWGQKHEEVTEIREELKQLEAAVAPIKPTVPVAPAVEDRPLRVGDMVWVPSLKRSGEIVTINGPEAEVAAGPFRVRAAIEDLELRAEAPAGAPESAKARRAAAGSVRAPVVDSPGMELDLRGHTVEEMLPLLDKYLDDAYLSGLPRVRIIHGKGTGTLRRVVRDELHKHPLVKNYREGENTEGGSGVTVAELMGAS
ncbi:MAG TPA: endonuclease MutS2 [Ardenticatenaceae bacterium]|nr:endonuclease MutS2 [Ardenticatenaceae bacterium]